MGDRLETSVQLAGIIDAAEKCVVNVNLGFPSGGCKAKLSISDRASPKCSTNFSGDQ